MTAPRGARPVRAVSAALVGAAQSGDRDSLNRLLASVQEPLFHHIRTIVGDGDVAADVLQDVLLTLWKKLPSLREPGWFRAWAYRIATREAVHQAKRMGRDSIAFDSGMLEHVGGDEIESRFDRELIDGIEERLAAVSPASQLVLRMHYLEGLTYAEIAEALEISGGTVKSRLSYGLGALRTALVSAENAKKNR